MADYMKLDDVMNDFFADLESGSTEVLTQYIEKHPQFETELHEAAGFFRATLEIPLLTYTPEQEDLLAAKTASLVQNALYELYHREPTVAQAESPDEIPGLLDAIESRGDTPQSFADKLRVSQIMVRMLDTREVKPESIPKKMFDLVANAMSVDVASILAYSFRPLAPTASHYKAEAAPEIVQTDFASLIEKDPLMSDEDKTYWLDQINRSS